MNELEQLWRERIDWVQASGLTIADASAELGVSVASVYRWKKASHRCHAPQLKLPVFLLHIRHCSACGFAGFELPLGGLLNRPRGGRGWIWRLD
jgi:hypothetical protein